ncbi:hypothetical protein L2E82_16407 [Cichorium intybus]|uniref:Uncharacterized protein n=1 Tax=Cichorium intybus TaxID=13427 RepID=A0ACB9F5H8_CICIN|nr:hypothetical protein L2E82_16407 [Cichorium intybus]
MNNTSSIKLPPSFSLPNHHLLLSPTPFPSAARGTMVLAEYTEFTGNFPAIATQCLQKLPSTNNKFTYNCDHHTFNFLVQDGYSNSPFPLLFHFDLTVVLHLRSYSALYTCSSIDWVMDLGNK